MIRRQNSHGPGSFHVGQPFNPFRLFTGIFIPEALARTNLVSPGAKMAYGRLARYAGQDGKCFPAVGTLAQEIGVGERQAQKYLAELETAKLIRRRTQFTGRVQTSNAIEFLWPRRGERSFRGGGERSFTRGGERSFTQRESGRRESISRESRRGPRLSTHESQKTRFAAGLPVALANLQAIPPIVCCACALHDG
jgi:Helix-turn-helix domain